MHAVPNTLYRWVFQWPSEWIEEREDKGINHTSILILKIDQRCLPLCVGPSEWISVTTGSKLLQSIRDWSTSYAFSWSGQLQLQSNALDLHQYGEVFASARLAAPIPICPLCRIEFLVWNEIQWKSFSISRVQLCLMLLNLICNTYSLYAPLISISDVSHNFFWSWSDGFKSFILIIDSISDII